MHITDEACGPILRYDIRVSDHQSRQACLFLYGLFYHNISGPDDIPHLSLSAVLPVVESTENLSARSSITFHPHIEQK